MTDGFLRWIVTYGQLGAIIFAVTAAFVGGISGFAGMELSRRSDEKLAAVLRQVGTVIGARWEPLTSTQIDALREKITAIKGNTQPGRDRPLAQIVYANAFGKDFAASIALAFKAAGWDTMLNAGGSFDDGIFVGDGPIASQLREAIQETTGIKSLRASRPDQQDHGFYFIGIGAKTE